MKSLLVTVFCISALGVILAGCGPKDPGPVEQAGEPTTTKVDAGGGEGRGGGLVPDLDIDR